MENFDKDYYIPRLRRMIECETVSVKGSFTPDEFMKLREVMKELFPLTHEKAEIMYFSEDCWIYKIAGKDSARNFMVMSHHDVVSATGDWKYPPFALEEHEDKLWGRGVFDTKGSVFAFFQAVEELLEEGFVPECNLYLGSSHNEEIFGDGIPEAVKYFKEQGTEFEIVLDEGGAITEPPIGGIMNGKCSMVGVHEKGRFTYTCTATNENAFQSLLKARSKNPVERMTAFISAVDAKEDLFIKRLNKQVADMFTYIAPHLGFPLKTVFSNMGLFGGVIKKIMIKINPLAAGLLGTTCNFTKIEGSSVERKCTATAYFQPLSMEDFEKDIEAFTELAKQFGITVEKGEMSSFSEPADISVPAFAYTQKCIEEIFPDCPVVPYTLPSGGTDVRNFRDICPCILRFAPFRVTNEQVGAVHLPNENIDSAAIPEGVRFYKHFIKNYK